MLRGDTVYLTALDPANAETARAWINDPDVNKWLLEGHIPISKAGELDWYARMDASPADHVLEIHVAEDGRCIGHVGLNDVDVRHGHGEISIVIGEKAEQNKGFGRDAIRTMLRFGFETLRLHRIEIRAAAGNDRALHLYRSIGFKDAVLDILENEWRALG
jgi:RimJ/RimL family protein N-acetyltransferase